VGLAALALLGAVLAEISLHREGMPAWPAGYLSALAFMLAIFWFIRRGVPRLWIPYGMFVLFLFVQAVMS
jgi:hypothetical protein